MNCPNACNGHGICSSMAYTAATVDPGTGPVYSYTTNWDAYMIYGCTCDQGWTGYDCALEECPTGDDPLTPGVDAVQLFQCNPTFLAGGLGTGGFYLQFQEATTVFIPATASSTTVTEALAALPTMQAFTLTFLGAGTTVCSLNTVVSIEFTQQFGEPQELLAVDASGNILNTAQGITWAYNTGSSLTVTTPGQTFYAVEGTKENAPCSNRGYCDQTSGECKCYKGFVTSNGNLGAGTRGDCGFAADPIQSCPGFIECSGHGVCSGFPTYTCACESGWMSGDCSQRTCPLGMDWFGTPTADNVAHLDLVECSNKGNCDRVTGECVCQELFEGDACERMVCPGEPSCSGHGICTSMSGLAQYNEVNGDIIPVTYGTVPNKPTTWDGKMVYGCACDEGYTGYDCSLEMCPYGDDSTATYTAATMFVTPHVAKTPAVQAFECKTVATPTPGYTFQLSFRNYITPPIPGTTLVYQLESILEALPSINNVAVSTTTNPNGPLCTASGVLTYITFYSPSGNPPTMGLIMDDASNFAAGTQVFTSTTGTTDYAECSGRGLCDYSMGTCKCFLGYGSSDGNGNTGQLEDCGVRVTYLPDYEKREKEREKEMRSDFKEWQEREKWHRPERFRKEKERDHRRYEKERDQLREAALLRERDRGLLPEQWEGYKREWDRDRWDRSWEHDRRGFKGEWGRDPFGPHERRYNMGLN